VPQQLQPQLRLKLDQDPSGLLLLLPPLLLRQLAVGL
jgi:hypothetical protein